MGWDITHKKEKKLGNANKDSVKLIKKKKRKGNERVKI